MSIGEADVVALEAVAMSVGLVVNAPEAFERDDFRAWLDEPSRRTATWHRPGEEPHEYSDVFVLVDGGYEGDASDMPRDVWEAICDAVYDAFCGGRPELPGWMETHVVVRLTNLTG